MMIMNVSTRDVIVQWSLHTLQAPNTQQSTRKTIVRGSISVAWNGVWGGESGRKRKEKLTKLIDERW